MKQQAPRNRRERRIAEANLRNAHKTFIDDINDKYAECTSDPKTKRVKIARATKKRMTVSLKRLSLPDTIVGRLQLIQDVLTRANESYEKGRANG